MPCPRECELEGKAPGLLEIVSLSTSPNHEFHRAGGCCGHLWSFGSCFKRDELFCSALPAGRKTC